MQCCGCEWQRWCRPPLPSTVHALVCGLPGCPFSLGQRPRQCTVATCGLTPSDGLLGSLQCPAAKTHAASSQVSPRHPGEVSRSTTAVSHVHSTHTWAIHVHITPVPTLHLTRQCQQALRSGLASPRSASPQHICCSYTQLYTVLGVFIFSRQPLLSNILWQMST